VDDVDRLYRALLEARQSRSQELVR
jgi:hypothetical protein